MIKYNRIGLFSIFVCVAFVGVGTTPRSTHAADGFYVGVNAGKNWASGGNGSTDVAGGLLNASLYDINAKSGGLVGGAIGYKFSDLWRTDVSYTRLKNILNWKGDFKGLATPTHFTSDTTSHVLLLNGYLHAKGLNEDTFNTFDPFIGAGIGFVRNRVTNVVETSNTGAFVSYPADGRELHPAIRVGVGVDTQITPALTFTPALDAYWLGEFQTGDTRVGASPTRIGAWTADGIYSVGVSLGLRYTF